VNPFEKLTRRADRFQQRHLVPAVVVAVIKKFGDDNAGTLVANFAFSAFVALFPLLLILVSVLSLILSGNPGLRASIQHSAFASFPLVGHQLSANIQPLHRSSVVGLAIGLAGLLWGSLGLAQAGLFAMAQIWNLPGTERPNYPRRLARGVGFLATLGTGLVLTSYLAGFGTFGRHDIGLGIGAELLAVVVAAAQYLLAFRILTPGPVETRRLVPGAIAGGIAWTLLLALGSYLIGHDLRNDSALYGTFATVLGLVAWVYLGTQLSIYAAELGPVLAYRLWPRALIQPPLTEADQRSLAFEATENRRRPEEVVAVDFTEAPVDKDDARTGANDEGG
jgi:YihY family inner membrane protein